jgi:hypothetical protein
VAPILRHIEDVVCNGNADHAGWVLDWMANIVQRPHLKTGVAILLYGQEGCGKGIIFEWFRMRVLGEYHTFQTPSPEIDLFGRFASGATGKVLIQIDECKSLYDHHDQLKNIITNNTIRVEEKNKDVYTLPNLCNLVFTTNNADCIRINPRERRMVLFKCADVYKGNFEYFKGLSTHLYDKPETAICFFEFLKQREIGPVSRNFQMDRPKTDFYKQTQALSIPPHMRFVSAIIGQNTGERLFTTNEMWERFVSWTSEQKKNMNARQRNGFFHCISEVDGLTITENTGVAWVRIDCPVARAYLIVNDLFDPNAGY